MGLSARKSEYLATRTTTIVHFVSSTRLTVFRFFSFAYVLHMSWCICGLGILHFFHLMNISFFWISDVVNGCFRAHTFSDFI